MDQNKLKILKEINYKVQKTCSLCVHANFFADDWSTCSIHEYNHAKHTGEPRELSIHKSGYCESFEPDATEVGFLGKFEIFLPSSHK